MKAKFTLLIGLFLLTTSIYAVKQTDEKTRNDAGNFLKNRPGMSGKSSEHYQFQRKVNFKRQEIQLKSAQAVKQRLDSFTSMEWDNFTSQWVTDYKAEFIYDANWNVVQYLDYELDEITGQLVLYWKSDLSYDSKGNMTQFIYYRFDETTNQITVTGKYVYTYDANGNVTQEIGYDWDRISNQFVMDMKYSYTYDDGGNLILEIRSYIYENQMETKYKTEYKYDNTSKLIQIVSFYSNENTGDWSNRNVEDYTYDSQGNKKLVVVTEYQGFWDGVDQYIKYNKEEYTYDSKGNNTLVLYANLRGSTNGVAYYSYSKDEYTYDAQGHVTQSLYSEKEVNSQWVVDSKEVNVFDDNGNNTQNFYYSNWNAQTSQWEDIYKEEYTYDNRYTKNDLILPSDWFDDEITHMITEIKEFGWDSSTNGWVSDYQTSLVYSPVNVTSVNQVDAPFVNVYPNPFSKSVSFSIPDSYSQISFELFDLQGRKLLSKAIGNNEKLSLFGLNSGMYLYNLNMDGKIQKGKLTKE